MQLKSDQIRSHIGTVLQSLRRNKSGNTLAMVAAGLVPMTAMVGSGVDISRAYMVQTRLQQACDAGVLAGRRAIGDRSFDDEAEQTARDYFNVNFRDGYLETTDLVFTPRSGDDNSAVIGNASVTIPTVVMNIFMIDDLNVDVSCEAQLEVANSDITFVLDTTGSMSCPEDADENACQAYQQAFPNREEGQSFQGFSTTSRLGALRESIDSFYNIVQGAAASSNARIRYSFVPYSQTVNTGYLLNSDWIVNNHDYQTAEQDVEITEEVTEFFRSRDEQFTSNCGGFFIRNTTPRVFGRFDTQYNGCIWDRTTTTTTYNIELEQKELDVSAYKTGTPVVDPTRLTTDTYTWDGCIEERDTNPSNDVRFSSGSGFTPAGLSDLDIDSTPTSDSTRWRPYWPEVYFRRDLATTRQTGSQNSPYSRNTFPLQNFLPPTACPQRARLLDEYDSVSDVRDYTDDLRPFGATYHDVGLIWGARLASPDGLFRSNVNETPGNGGFVGRHVIFMTDGVLVANNGFATTYGIERHDSRITGIENGTSQFQYNQEQSARHTQRYSAMCSAIKAKGIRVWVIAFNTSLSNDLTRCASTDSSFTANDANELNAAFSSIAEQIAELRLTR